MTSAEHVLRELAADGVWTQRQLETRLAVLALEPPSRYLSRVPVIVKPTAWAHRHARIDLIRPNTEGHRFLRSIGVRPQEVRPVELEHGLGLAELRWRCGISVEHYRAQHTLARDHRRGAVWVLAQRSPTKFLKSMKVWGSWSTITVATRRGRSSASSEVSDRRRALKAGESFESSGVRRAKSEPLRFGIWGSPKS